jgi:hypothetical protein
MLLPASTWIDAALIVTPAQNAERGMEDQAFLCQKG